MTKEIFKELLTKISKYNIFTILGSTLILLAILVFNISFLWQSPTPNAVSFTVVNGILGSIILFIGHANKK
jgi:hypothetical protein